MSLPGRRPDIGPAGGAQVPPEAVAGNVEAAARFRNEARVARTGVAPQRMPRSISGETGGRYFLSMEYVDGEDLGSLLRRIGRLPYDKGPEIARKLCAALAAAHERGVLHRDLKPANVMLDGRGQVRTHGLRTGRSDGRDCGRRDPQRHAGLHGA